MYAFYMHHMPNANDACATNSTSCEASILKENVELRAQLELLTSKYGKLEESHEKLSSSNDDLLASYASLKLSHEAITTKVTSCEPHVDNSTTLTKMLYCHVLVLVVHPLVMLAHLVMNYFLCLVALTMKLLLPLVLLLHEPCREKRRAQGPSHFYKERLGEAL